MGRSCFKDVFFVVLGCSNAFSERDVSHLRHLYRQLLLLLLHHDQCG